MTDATLRMGTALLDMDYRSLRCLSVGMANAINDMLSNDEEITPSYIAELLLDAADEAVGEPCDPDERDALEALREFHAKGGRSLDNVIEKEQNE